MCIYTLHLLHLHTYQKMTRKPSKQQGKGYWYFQSKKNATKKKMLLPSMPMMINHPNAFFPFSLFLSSLPVSSLHFPLSLSLPLAQSQQLIHRREPPLTLDNPFSRSNRKKTKQHPPVTQEKKRFSVSR